MKPVLTLVLPRIAGLLTHLLSDPRARQTLPGFYTFSCKARSGISEPTDPYTAVSRVLNLPAGDAGFPHAAYAQCAASGQPVTGSWLNISPVSHTSASSGLLLRQVDSSSLSENDCIQIEQLLSDNGRFRPERGSGAIWRIDAAGYSDFHAAPLYAVADQPIALHMPSGRDATFWAAWLSEKEMLLHDHPLNQAREREGLAPVSGFWLWGCGTLPEKMLSTDAPQLLTTDETLCGLAKHHGVSLADLNTETVDWRAARVVAADFSRLDDSHDSGAVMEWLAQLDASWMATALRLIRTRQLGEMQLLDPLAGVTQSLRPLDLKKFWRNKPLPALSR